MPPGIEHRDLRGAAKLQVDNWRWAGVPFYVRTGKRLPEAAWTEIAIQFQHAPTCSSAARLWSG